MVSEERIEFDGDWGYTVIYRATAPDGRASEMDGSCMASEKRGAMCTVHNVRAHAHTRAKNRAISDLVGFGEVSADELGPDAFRDEPPSTQAAPPTGPPNEEVRKDGTTRTKGDGPISKAMAKPLWVASFKASELIHGKGDEHKFLCMDSVVEKLGYGKLYEVPASKIEEVKSLISAYPQAQQADGDINF
jgi:hypothetical protein